MTPVKYRQMRAADEEAVLDLWMQTWPAAHRETTRRAIRTDPHYLQHTHLAVSPEGRILSTAHYWLRQVRDAQGKPRLTGCISHVTTHPEARKQGHAGHLVESVLEAMEREGCEWSLLFSSEMGLTLYPRYGYQAFSAPYRRGLLSGRRPPGGDAYSVELYDPFVDPRGWEPIARIYAAYNESRPLTFVRDGAYWEGLVATRSGNPAAAREMKWFVARSKGGNREPCGYVLIRFSSDRSVRDSYGLDQVAPILELGALPSHRAAIPALLSIVVEHADRGRIGCRVHVPREPETEEALEVLLEQPVSDLEDWHPMARPLAPGTGFEDIEATFYTPGSIFWPMDEF